MIRAKKWLGKNAPAKILVIRFHALGDLVITLPYLHSLRVQYPHTELHLLTRDEFKHIPKHIKLFDRIFTVMGRRNAKVQFLRLLLKLPFLFAQRYDAVLDLQNNRISRILRRIIRPKSWTEFDTLSPISAGDRTQRTLEALWDWKVSLLAQFSGGDNDENTKLLERNGYISGHELVILNPAGFCDSRNWPLKNYVQFAKKWREKVNDMTQFILLLLPVHNLKARYLKEKIGEACIDLTGKADQVQAFGIIQRSSLMLTEDSGLMHMAWTQEVPTVALFSSSRKEWSGPQGAWSTCLDSADLECGPCNLEVCKFRDNRCLTRYTADDVLERAIMLRSMHIRG